MLCKASPRRKFYIGRSNDITKKQKPKQKRATAAQGSSKAHDPPPPQPSDLLAVAPRSSHLAFLPLPRRPTSDSTCLESQICCTHASNPFASPSPALACLAPSKRSAQAQMYTGLHAIHACNNVMRASKQTREKESND